MLFIYISLLPMLKNIRKVFLNIFFLQNKSKNLKTKSSREFWPFFGTPCRHKIKFWNLVKTTFIHSSYAYILGLYTNLLKRVTNWCVLEHILVVVYFAGQKKHPFLVFFGCIWPYFPIFPIFYFFLLYPPKTMMFKSTFKIWLMKIGENL